jgi:hypothetical protein
MYQHLSMKINQPAYIFSYIKNYVYTYMQEVYFSLYWMDVPLCDGNLFLCIYMVVRNTSYFLILDDKINFSGWYFYILCLTEITYKKHIDEHIAYYEKPFVFGKCPVNSRRILQRIV